MRSLLTLEDTAGFLFSSPVALMFVWQRAPHTDVLFLPPSPLSISSLLHHPCGRSGTKPLQDKCTTHTGGRRRPLHTLYSQHLSLDSLKLSGCKSSWAVSTSLEHSGIGRFFPVLPIIFLLCLSMLCCPYLHDGVHSILLCG